MFPLVFLLAFTILACCVIHRLLGKPSSASSSASSSKLSDSSLTVPTPITVSRRPTPLPQEILGHIFSFYIVSLIDGLRCETVRDYRMQKKRLMRELWVVGQCSRLFNRITMECLGRMWASCGLGLCSPSRDAHVANRPARCVWIITTERGCLPLDIDLAVHTMLEIASINYHDGVQWFKSQQEFRRFRCVSAYPRSLRQLEILHSHTPEEEIIRLVSSCCSSLTELRIVRCTMFNDPNCWYWRTHTRNQDHDYMKSYDPTFVVDYANHMALLLLELPQLESIHIGHYLIGINTVHTHRTDEAHKRYHLIADRMRRIDGVCVMNYAQLAASMGDGPPVYLSSLRLADRELWASSCPQCERDFRKPIEKAERLATSIIGAHLRPLKHVSFASFLSDRRIRPSSWLVGRQMRGQDLYVLTEDPNHPRSRLMQAMVRTGNRWEPVL